MSDKRAIINEDATFSSFGLDPKVVPFSESKKEKEPKKEKKKDK